MSTGNLSPGGPDPSRRRSQRVILSLAVTVRTEAGPRDKSFEEETHTLVVNLQGALVVLAAKVAKGQKVWLTNRATQGKCVSSIRAVPNGISASTRTGVWAPSWVIHSHNRVSVSSLP